MSALENRFKEFQDFFNRLPHCEETGMVVTEVSEGRAVMKIGYDERMIGNPVTRYIHGGVLTALLDTVSSVSVTTASPEIEMVATLDLRIDYLKPAPAGEEITAVAECYKATKNIGFVRASAYTGSPDNQFATCQATFMITRRKEEI